MNPEPEHIPHEVTAKRDEEGPSERCLRAMGECNWAKKRKNDEDSPTECFFSVRSFGWLTSCCSTTAPTYGW